MSALAAFRIVSHNTCLLITVTVINISLTVIEVNNDPKYNSKLKSEGSTRRPPIYAYSIARISSTSD